MKRFHALAELAPEEIHDLLALASRLEREPEPRALAGKILALLFFNPSLRTLASMQAAMARLGGTSIVLAPGQGTWQLETRDGAVMDGAAAEHVREAIPVLAGYADALGIRAFASGSDLAADLDDRVFRQMAALAPLPTSTSSRRSTTPARRSPTGRRSTISASRAGGKLVLSWANHPKPLPLAVPAAVVQMAAARGMEVVVLRPEAYALPDEVMARARHAAAISGGRVSETADRAEAMAGAHALYGKSWASAAHYGDAAAESELRSSPRRLDDRPRLVRPRRAGRALPPLPAGAAQRRGERRGARRRRAARSSRRPHNRLKRRWRCSTAFSGGTR